jgi:hypothetical protein
VRQGTVQFPITVKETIMEKTYTRTEAGTAIQAAADELSGDEPFVEVTLKRLGNEPSYTREQIASAVNAAADVLGPDENGGENSDTIRMQDRGNLFVNLAIGFLEKPAATADEIIAEQYPENDPDEVWSWI